MVHARGGQDTSAVLLSLLLLLLVGCSSGQKNPVVPAQRADGGELYRVNCQTCHGGATGGAMMDIPPPHNASGHTWHHPDCQLVDTVLSGSGERGEMMRRMMGIPEEAPRMPAFQGTLTDQEVTAILQHIKTWWTEDQRLDQARVTSQLC